MNCATHNTVAAVAYCRTCGKPLCATCVRDVRGTIFCEHCLAERVAGALPPTPASGTAAAGTTASYSGERLPSPGLAALLGFIPGVGAMYNGQFIKGFIHVMAFVCMIWMASRFGPIMIPVFFAYFFYLVFDAYKTAHALELGQPVPDPLGFERMFGPTPHYGTRSTGASVSSSAVATNVAADDGRYRKNVPTGAVVLIGLGVLFTLHTVGLFDYDIGRYWSLILVFLGGWMLARRWGMFGSTGAVCECDRCRMRCIMWPIIFITSGILILLDEFGVSIWRTWPAILLVIGAVKLVQSNASDAGHIGGPPVLPPPAVLPPVQPSDNPRPGQDEPSSEVNHV
jgi:TM2 domain-containing membrane protein YozV